MTSWKQDSKGARCGICIKKFGILRRRHHCRAVSHQAHKPLSSCAMPWITLANCSPCVLQCGDICCRRCLGFCLVDVPHLGVDLAYTCARCIRHHTRANSLVHDFAQLAQSFDSPYEARMRRCKSGTFLTQSTSDCGSPVSPTGSTSSLASALTPCGSPRAWEAEYQVIVSQYHNQKLHSVCSLLGDYLECKGGAIVLADEQHIWVLAHKGLRSSVLHSDTFLSICHNAMQGREPFSVSKRKRSVGQQHDEAGDRNAFHFFSAAPIFEKGRQHAPLGCIIALDTHPRDDTTARKVEKTIQNLAQLVMNLLVEEKTILRIYSSGDFKIFASNGLDLAPSNATPFEKFGVAPSPKSSAAGTSEISRSKSFAMGEEQVSFFSRYADASGHYPYDPSSPNMKRNHLHGKSGFERADRQHAASNPEKKKHSVPRRWKNESTLRVA